MFPVASANGGTPMSATPDSFVTFVIHQSWSTSPIGT